MSDPTQRPVPQDPTQSEPQDPEIKEEENIEVSSNTLGATTTGIVNIGSLRVGDLCSSGPSGAPTSRLRNPGSIKTTILYSKTPYLVSPRISNVMGNFSDGELITLTGFRFGDKLNAVPLKWDNFENGTHGDALGNGWNVMEDTVNTKPVLYDSNPTDELGNPITTRPNSTMCAKQAWEQGTSNYGCGFGLSEDSDPIFPSEQTSDKPSELYITVVRYNHYYGGLCENFKVLILEGPGADFYPQLWEQLFPDQSKGVLQAKECTPDFSCNEFCTGSGEFIILLNQWLGSTVDWPLDQWHRTEHLIVNSDVDTENGAYYYWRDCQLYSNYTVENQCWHMPRTHNCDWRRLWFPRYFRRRNNAHNLIWNDYVYIDTTRARVEIGDNQTWENCTHREIQIPVYWRSPSGRGEIQVQFNQGSFGSGEIVYLFVVNEDGEVTPGYPIRIE